MCRAYFVTHGTPVVVTHCSNNYGPYQFPEKLIPLFVTNALDGKPLPVYGDGKNIRSWLHVDDHTRGIALVLTGGRAGETYNIGGGTELSNRELTQLLLDATGRVTSVADIVKRERLDQGYVSRLLKLAFLPPKIVESIIAGTQPADWTVHKLTSANGCINGYLT